MDTSHPLTKQEKPDKQDLYNVGYGSIFFRNFTAGFARALGAITVYLVLGGVIYYAVVTYLLPQLTKLIPSSFPLFGPASLYQGNLPETENGASRKITITEDEAAQVLEILEKDQH